MPELLEVVQTNEPRLLGFNVFANEEGTEIAGVQIHPDVDSMLSHIQVMRERVTMAYDEYIDATTAIQVYGPPNDAVLDMITQMSTPGVSVSVNPTTSEGSPACSPAELALTAGPSGGPRKRRPRSVPASMERPPRLRGCVP